MAKRIRIRGMRGLLGRAVARVVRLWMGTLRYEVVYRDRELDPVHGEGGPRVYLVWHEVLAAPLYLRPHANVSILVSRHRDADVLEAIAAESGFGCVRGSTNRGGVAALRALAERGRSQHLVITPDGPLGPRRRLAPGPVFLASHLGLPIVVIAVAYDRCWRAPTWDRFAIPIPFTTARVVLGAELPVAAYLDREGLECRRCEIEAVANALTAEAEAWAATRRTRPDAEVGRRARPGEARRMPLSARRAA